MLEHCDKWLLKCFAPNVDLETLKYQHHVIQRSLRSQGIRKHRIKYSSFHTIFFSKHARPCILPLCGVDKGEREKRIKEILKMEMSDLAMFYLQKFKYEFTSTGSVEGCVVLGYQVFHGLRVSYGFSELCSRLMGILYT